MKDYTLKYNEFVLGFVVTDSKGLQANMQYGPDGQLGFGIDGGYVEQGFCVPDSIYAEPEVQYFKGLMDAITSDEQRRKAFDEHMMEYGFAYLSDLYDISKS